MDPVIYPQHLYRGMFNKHIHYNRPMKATKERKKNRQLCMHAEQLFLPSVKV